MRATALPQAPAQLFLRPGEGGSLWPKVAPPDQLEEMSIEYDPHQKVVWCRFDFADRPCFTWAVFRDIAHIKTYLQRLCASAPLHELPVRYVVLGSTSHAVWNLGGDLALFSALIRSRDRDALLYYAQLACEAGYNFHTSFGLPLITVSLVQGDALGGGFEAALSSNLIVAERRAQFGFPEILFSLFPGMGAYSFLARRIAPAIAQRMIMSGNIVDAEQLHRMGIVDILAEDDDGERALCDWIARNHRRHNAHLAVLRLRQSSNPVTLDELTEIARVWVDVALSLEEPDLRRMARLVAAQDRHRKRVQI